MNIRGPLCAFVLLSAATELRAETTIYVGKHFEVRDHDAPVKYIFNGNTRVARVTGSLSANERIQRLRLRAGWNLVSLAVTASNLSDQLQKSNVVTKAYSWNPPASNYVAVVPGAVPAGTVLWINATNNATIGIVGTYTNPVNRALNAGATYLATAGLEAWSPTIPLTMAAWSFNPQLSTLNPQPTWHPRLTGVLSSINELPPTFAPGQALYVIVDSPSELAAPDPTLRIRYYHQDHLGSSSAMTDANGALIEEASFYPFGEARNEYRLRQIEESYKFTQKERDEESRLHYFEARYLAGVLSRFLTPDPKFAHPDALSDIGPQDLNLYSYAHSNPLRFTDPTGLDDRPTDRPTDDGATVGKTLYGAFGWYGMGAVLDQELDRTGGDKKLTPGRGLVITASGIGVASGGMACAAGAPQGCALALYSVDTGTAATLGQRPVGAQLAGKALGGDTRGDVAYAIFGALLGLGTKPVLPPPPAQKLLTTAAAEVKTLPGGWNTLPSAPRADPWMTLVMRGQAARATEIQAVIKAGGHPGKILTEIFNAAEMVLRGGK